MEESTMQQAAAKEPNHELAYFKFALIAPVIQGTFPDASAAAYYRRVTQQAIARPDGAMFPYKPATLERWASLYKTGGMEALMPGERADKGSVKALSDECILEIHKIKEKFPKLDAVQIHIRLIQEGLLPATVSARTIQRFIKDNGLKTTAASGQLKDRKAFEEPYFGALWQADTCYLPYIQDGPGKKKRTFLILIVDDYSRMIVGAHIFLEDNAYNFQRVLKEAVSTYGIPEKIYCDHGSTYENSQNKLICGSIGAILLYAPVRDGAAKGKCERAFKTLKSRWLNGLDTGQIRSVTEFNIELSEAVRKHNLTINSSTGQTPMNRFLDTRGRIRFCESRNWMDECFMNRVYRRVKGDSTLSLQNMQFDAPMQFMRQTVEVRFLPGELSGAYIFDKGARHLLKMTDRQANSKAKRESWPTVDYSKGGGGDV
jgi:transposase InsO family protein